MRQLPAQKDKMRSEHALWVVSEKVSYHTLPDYPGMKVLVYISCSCYLATKIPLCGIREPLDSTNLELPLNDYDSSFDIKAGLRVAE